MIYSLTLFYFILAVISTIFVFIISPTAQGLGESSRIIYLHVPFAWIAALSFAISGFSAAAFLLKKKKEALTWMESSIDTGILFTAITIITGSIWAKNTWGSYWNWDPRESSIAILMMIYGAVYFLKYFLSRSSLSSTSVGVVRASYILVAAVLMPLLVFIIPRIYPSLHPDTIINSDKKVHLEGVMVFTLLLSIFTSTILYVIIMNISLRIKRLEG